MRGLSVEPSELIYFLGKAPLFPKLTFLLSNQMKTGVQNRWKTKLMKKRIRKAYFVQFLAPIWAPNPGLKLLKIGFFCQAARGPKNAAQDAPEAK